VLEADVVAGAALVADVPTWLTAELAIELPDAALALLVIATADDPVADPEVLLATLPVELAVLLAQVAAVGRLVTPAEPQMLSAYFKVAS